MLIIVVPIGIKSEPDNEFENLGSQKMDFYVLRKKLIFQWEMGYLFKIENFCTYFSIFHNFRDWASFSPHFV